MRWAQLLKRGFDIDIERTGGAGGSVSGGVRSESGLDFDRAGGGVRPERGQSLRLNGIQAR